MENEKRLIDANALIEEVKKNNKSNFYEKDWSSEDVCILLRKFAPTVDAVEVVHGRWIAVPSSDMMTGKAYKCSECNKMRYGSFMPNYCQNCGAKMDGDGNG